ncbi:ribonuclease T2 [Microvirga antarctica]|uniref:ribonuclease T2 n=1 Tax=Microvirga antarctica TaxID=2819233 RepID=UPI001FE768D3|nr:ribonuclease T2 [Microvirga antarctica]
MRLSRLVVAAGLLLSALVPAFGQAMRETRGAAAGNFDFYVLALSWSPGFCETSSTAKENPQCAPGNGLGFVTHGLWPQSEAGYPSFCEPSGRFVPRAVIEQFSGLFPDENLARYEWRKHGSCTGESPSGYFAAVKAARERVTIPDRLTKLATGSRVMPMEIERAFAEANPGLRPDMMSVSCGRRVFQEIRICLDRDLRNFRQCPEVDRDTCRANEISIPVSR